MCNRLQCKPFAFQCRYRYDNQNPIHGQDQNATTIVPTLSFSLHIPGVFYGSA